MEAELTDEALLGLEAPPLKSPAKISAAPTKVAATVPSSMDQLLNAPSVPKVALKPLQSKEEQELEALTAELGI